MQRARKGASKTFFLKLNLLLKTLLEKLLLYLPKESMSPNPFDNICLKQMEA